MNEFTITHNLKKPTVAITSEEKSETLQKEKLDTEFSEIIALLDISNRKLADK
ncbi:hypothetical protein [Xenorhabdus littoralis]|uniref:hypothetical protein n=1 Tax=Xenorhabdus littoralis TaxID=2582835 RepID=UPI0029E807DA|nr:hypothetical protein [Xenorhabdus sp. Reich]